MLFSVRALLGPLGLCKMRDPKMDPRRPEKASGTSLITHTAQQGESTCIVYIHLFIPEHLQNFCLNTIQAQAFLLICFIKLMYIFTIICMCISSCVIQYKCSLPLNLLRCHSSSVIPLKYAESSLLMKLTPQILQTYRSLPRFKKQLEGLMEENSVRGYEIHKLQAQEYLGVSSEELSL